LSLQQDLLSDRVAARWLYELQRDVDGLPWSSIESLGRGSEDQRKARVATFEAALFEQKLIEAMNDGVLFVDSQSRITLWNKYAEKLTGISRGAAIGRVFAPSLVEMSGHGNRRIHDGMCPVARCIKTNSQIRQRLMILGRQGNLVSIDLHAIPVQSTDGTIHGATVLLLDARREAALAERCEALHEEATRDPLTRVANRAEFDRVLQLMVETSQESRQPCSLIMLDIDHFKQVNDTYGHQAGDEAIVGVANLLSSTCRSGDLVARYGGEEFVVLCSDCTNADAVRRAEELRKQLQETHFSFLNNGKLTASFGVTELQAGDTCETMLRRADRALLMAKEQGRNQVVQLGNGMEKHKAKGKWWWLGRWTSPVVIETSVWTAVPIDIAIAKLRGFVSDHRAKVVKTHGTIIELEVSSANVSSDRRKNDRTIDFRVEMDFSEERINSQNSAGFACGENANTRITLKIRPRRSAKRRRVDVAERAKMLLQSLKAYLMAKEKTELDAENSVIMVGYGV
jgi:diguanylate cyclase (GGDEF)-like protein/PAS domain S-box-containing protein